MPSVNESQVADQQQSQSATCAECRRLRLQCDKRLPCRSCVRRGCPELCPKGTKLTANGTRTVLAATKELHDTVKHLRDRIRQLETSLNDLHIDRTGRTHPLLALAQVDPGAEEDSELSVIESTTEQQNPMQKTVLIRGRDGAHRIAAAHGRTWAIHSLGDHTAPSSAPDAVDYARAHFPGIQLRRWPFAPAVPVPFNTIIGLQQRIPPQDVLHALLNVFLQSLGSTSLAAAFPEMYIRNVIIPNARSPSGGRSTATALGSLFAILAIGSLFAVDCDEAPEVSYYGDLSSAVLIGQGAFSSPSMETVEAIWLRALLEFLRQDQLEERARGAMAVAAQMCLALGLHRDSASLGLCSEVVERRRSVFWMVFKTDVWESLCIGRPGVFTFQMDFIDVRPPAGPDEYTDSGSGPGIFKFVLVIEMIARATLSLKSPGYTEILKLDHTIRTLDQHRRIARATIPPTKTLLLYLHRAYYVRALKEHGADPQQSQYCYSFNAVLHPARDTLSWANVVIRQSPAMCARFYWIWSLTVTATMIYAVMLEHAPECEFVPESRAALKSSLELFQLGITYGSGRAKQALTMFNNIEDMEDFPPNHASLDMKTPIGQDAKDASYSVAATNGINLHDQSTTKHAVVVGRRPPRAAQYSVGLLKQPEIGRNHRSRDTPQSQKLMKGIDIMHDPWLVTGNKHSAQSRDPSQSGPGNAPVNEAPPSSSPWPIWKGQGWGGMDQCPMELTVPDGPESLGSFGPAVAESWLTSLGFADPSWTGGLNGEWAASSDHL